MAVGGQSVITGYVNRFLEAVIPIAILDSNGHRWRNEVVIDTGFSGDLTLPAELIVEMALVQSGEIETVQADGQPKMFNYYRTAVLWDGNYHEANVLESATESLLGVNLLTGRLLTVQMVVGGNVLIEELPAE